MLFGLCILSTRWFLWVLKLACFVQIPELFDLSVALTAYSLTEFFFFCKKKQIQSWHHVVQWRILLPAPCPFPTKHLLSQHHPTTRTIATRHPHHHPRSSRQHDIPHQRHHNPHTRHRTTHRPIHVHPKFQTAPMDQTSLHPRLRWRHPSPPIIPRHWRFQSRSPVSIQHSHGGEHTVLQGCYQLCE